MVFYDYLPGCSERFAKLLDAHPLAPKLWALVEHKWPRNPPPFERIVKDTDCWAIVETIYLEWHWSELELKSNARTTPEEPER